MTHYRYTIERALVYPPKMLAEGYENDTYNLVYSFADYGHALDNLRVESVRWGDRAKHQIRDTSTGEIIATAERFQPRDQMFMAPGSTREENMAQLASLIAELRSTE
mgnify:CR=1 FL=1